MKRIPASLFATGLFLRQCSAQASGWQADQINATMCEWQLPRIGIVRNMLYIDGGDLFWLAGMADGTIGNMISDSNPLGLVYTLNFSIPFSTSGNTSTLFNTLSKGSVGGLANNIEPLYYDGAMLANDYGWFTYGGLLAEATTLAQPDGDSVTAYGIYPQRLSNSQFTNGFVTDVLPINITRYVTYGGSVSIPSENLGFHFADQLSLTLIELNMAVQGREIWNNYTLPTAVPGRAGPEIVWIPVSTQGILVAIGGVIYPTYSTPYQADNNTATTTSEAQSPGFMSTVSVYDIANQIWYEQNTTGAPSAFTQGCAVVASAQDGSSHNIYYYGGFDGLNPRSAFNDDVWILSVPSFMWTKIKSGNSSHARAGHRCVKPYPDQMFVIGGYNSLIGSEFQCVAGGVVQIFNLNSNTWLTSYDPNIWSNYEIPSMIYALIGGSEQGSATQVAPSPTGFANPSMTPLFGTPYNNSKITTWYPYATKLASASNATTGNETTANPIPASVSGSRKSPTLGIALGVIFGLLGIALIVVSILLARRRSICNSYEHPPPAESLDKRSQISKWLRKNSTSYAQSYLNTVLPDTGSIDPPPAFGVQRKAPAVPEMPGMQIHEMMDTSLPYEFPTSAPRSVELHDTSMHPNLQKSNPSFNRANVSTLPSLEKVRNESDANPSPSTNSQTSAVSSLSPVAATSSSYLRRITSILSDVSVEGEPSPKKSPAHSPIMENDSEATCSNLISDIIDEDTLVVEKVRMRTTSNFSEDVEEARGRN